MKFRLQLKESVGNLLMSKMRSILTLLGILVGTASVVALVSSGQLATQHALEQFKILGTDLLAVSIEAGPADSGASGEQVAKLDLDKVLEVEKSVPEVVMAAPYTTDFSTISYAGNVIQGNVVGATEALSDVVKINIQSGRFVSYLDDEEFFCVIGNEIAKNLKDLGVINPLGKQIRVGRSYFTIVGVAQPWTENMFMYTDINKAIIMPINTSLTLNKFVGIQNIIFKLTPNADIEKVEQAITAAIQKYLPNAKLFPRSPKQLVESMQKQQQTFTLMLGAIGGISLIVGGIGVMNIMLVSVTERRREIGIRMAIGAKRRDIQQMFLTESVMLTLFGGLLGVLIGVAVSLGIALFSGWSLHVFFLPPAIGFLVSAIVGIFFGIYPAIKASKLDPITTLRSE